MAHQRINLSWQMTRAFTCWTLCPLGERCCCAHSKMKVKGAPQAQSGPQARLWHMACATCWGNAAKTKKIVTATVKEWIKWIKMNEMCIMTAVFCDTTPQNKSLTHCLLAVLMICCWCLRANEFALEWGKEIGLYWTLDCLGCCVDKGLYSGKHSTTERKHIGGVKCGANDEWRKDCINFSFLLFVNWFLT